MKGSKNVNAVDVGQNKTIIIMFTLGADGRVILPMLVYPNKRRTFQIRKGITSECGSN